MMQPSKEGEDPTISVTVMSEQRDRSLASEAFHQHDRRNNAEHVIKRLEKKHGFGFLENAEAVTIVPDPAVRLEAGHYIFVLLDKPQGISLDQSVDLRPYVGHEGEGLKAREYLTKREATVEKVFNAVLKVGAVMVTAPPQSGKTSLLQLLLVEKRAMKSRLFTFVLYLDMAEVNGSLQKALEPHCLDWEPFLAASRKGTNGGILLLLDEAQCLYGKEDNFWCAIKMLHQGPPPGKKETSTLRVVLATSYLCSPAVFAEGFVFNWDRSCTITLDYHRYLDVGLQFQDADPEFGELIDSFRKQHWKDALPEEDVRKRVIEDTAGQVGLITGLLDAVAKQLEGRPYVAASNLQLAGAFDAKLRECLDSGGLQHWAMVLPGFVNFLLCAGASPETMAVLGKLLGKKCWNEGICGFEFAYWKEAESMYRKGHLNQREVNSVDYIGFISPLHRRICKQLGFKDAPEIPAGG